MPSTPLSLILILGALTAIGPISTDIYLPAFPALGAEFGVAEPAVQRTLAASFLGMAVGQCVWGPLSDRFGRRMPLIAGMAAFGLASAGCALAGSILGLTWLRLLQALGGCAGSVVSRAVVRDRAEGAAMLRLMAQLMLVFGVAPILGPVLGGWLLGTFGWRAIFWLLAAYALAMVAAIALWLPETLPPEQRQPGGPAQVLGTYLRLLRDRRFMGYVLAGAFPVAGMFAYIAGSPFVFMELHGVRPEHYGLYFGANALGIMTVSQLIGRLAHRLPLARILQVAQAVSVAAGFALLLAAVTGWGGFPALVATLFLYIASLGGVMPVTGTLAMAPMGRIAGSASALLGTVQFAGGALIAMLMGTLHDGTARPMAALVAGLALAGWIALQMLVPPASARP